MKTIQKIAKAFRSRYERRQIKKSAMNEFCCCMDDYLESGNPDFLDRAALVRSNYL